ncbi:MAG: sulfatase-like hydrolase/transferase [Planctomycetota bacterium]
MNRAALLSLLLFCAACGDESAERAPTATRDENAPLRSAPSPPRSLLLLSIDTLRADRLGCYGYSKAETRVIDQLAREGVLFEHLSSVVPLTLPSHTSMLTGTIPEFHGARDNGSFQAVAELPTLAEALRSRGFRTGAFVAAFVLDSQFGLDQGFETYGDVPQRLLNLGAGYEERAASQVNAEALAWLDSLQPDERFFMFVHYFEPHRPYQPPTGVPHHMKDRPYDAEVTSVDAALGRLLEGLRSRGRLEETLLVVTSDHGESLGEHGEDCHGFFVYEGVLHVPLILVHSSLPAGLRVPDRVSLVDLVPTILETLGAGVPELPPPARSLLPLIRGEVLEPAPTYFECFSPFYSYGWAPLRGVALGGYKLIRSPRPELYNLDSDPGEEKNVIAEGTRIARSLEEHLAALLEANHHGRPASPAEREASAEVLEKLAALGYLRAAAKRELSDDLLDPKDGFAKVRKRDIAFAHYERGEHAKALAVIEEILAEDPANATFQSHAGALLVSLKRFAEAVPHLRVSLAGLRTAGNAYNLAECLTAVGEHEEAEQRYREALELNPKHLASWLRLGDLLGELGRKEEARECYRSFLEHWEGDPRTAQQVRAKLEH